MDGTRLNMRNRILTAVILFTIMLISSMGIGAEDVYSRIYRNAVDAHIDRAAKHGNGKINTISVACYSWILAQRTGEKKYRDFALRLYDEYLLKEVNNDFHHSRPFGLLTYKLNQAGLLSGKRRALAVNCAKKRINWFLDERRMDEEFFDCNIALADTLAVSCLGRALKNESVIRFSDIADTVSRFGKRIIKTGDLNENAANYSSLGICFFLELADVEGWYDDIAESIHFRNMFDRQLEIISPSGQIPEFGDSYYEWNRCRLDFAYLLETASRLYDDPIYIETARNIVPADTDSAEEDNLFRGYHLLTLEPFESQKKASLKKPSVILHRRVPTNPVQTHPDKLILRTGRNNGDSMIMIDLYAEGSHAHRFKRPSIGYYEVSGVPLFHNIGRRGTRTAQCGNIFWIWDDADDFPGYPKENEWNTMSIPSDYCFPADQEGRYKISRDILFRNFKTPELKFLRLDNIHLEGPRGICLLDGFESEKTWHPNVSRQPGVQIVSSRDRTEGKFSQEINWGVINSGFRTRLFEQEHLRNTTFDIRDYEWIRLDYKYSGRHPRCNLRFITRPGRWINLGNRSLECVVDQAVCRQLGKDAWASVALSSYNGRKNKLNRRIVLTEEGFLVVSDTFIPGPEANISAGGQLWQMYHIKEKGDDWFASSSDGIYTDRKGSDSSKRMLVKYMPGPDVTIGYECRKPSAMHALRADGSRYDRYYTTFSKTTINRGMHVQAAMVVVPINDNDDAAIIAEDITFDTSGTRLSVKIKSQSNANLDINLNKDRVIIRRTR